MENEQENKMEQNDTEKPHEQNKQTNQNQSKNTSKRKRRRPPFGESTQIAYSQIDRFISRPSSGRPRSPHRFFESSYNIILKEETAKRDDDDGGKNENVDDGRAEETKKTDDLTLDGNNNINNRKKTQQDKLCQVVHSHVNGLCIVTVGEQVPENVTAIKFVVKEAPPTSAGMKRKRQSKMLRGGKVEDTVQPTTLIAELHLDDGEIIPLYACVWGTILELNHSLTCNVLKGDPLLDGYLAVILPTGKFPPNEQSIKTTTEDHQTKRQREEVVTTADEDIPQDETVTDQ